MKVSILEDNITYTEISITDVIDIVNQGKTLIDLDLTGEDLTKQQMVDSAYDKARSFAYIEISDPIFFKVARGDMPEGSWENSVNDIKLKLKTPKVF